MMDWWHNQAHHSWKNVCSHFYLHIPSLTINQHEFFSDVNNDLDVTALRKLSTTTNPADLIMNENLRVAPGLVGDLLDNGFALRRKHKKGYKDDSCEWVQDEIDAIENIVLYEVDAACGRTKSADH